MDFAEGVRTSKPDNRRNVWVVAHRGASWYAPENTMAAFRKAVELGAQFIETDLQATRDAGIVALHDPTLDRTTNGHGPVYAHTFEEVRQLDAGSWYRGRAGASFVGERVPSIQEILRFGAQHDINLYLEIKTHKTWGTENAIVAALHESGEAERVVMLSFDPNMLEAVHRLDGTVMTGLLCDQPGGDLVERALRIGARQLAPRGDLVTPDLVEKAHESDLPVVAWTINEPKRMRRLIAAGVDGIMSDYPDRLVQALKEV
jgi:glycerophosphoryl diester phosphodiesterase